MQFWRESTTKPISNAFNLVILKLYRDDWRGIMILEHTMVLLLNGTHAAQDVRANHRYSTLEQTPFAGRTNES